jgi:hypothetical protein
MTSRATVAFTVLASVSLLTAHGASTPSAASGEYSKHFGPLAKLSVAVAQAMPADQYSFRPQAESMDFGQLMSHIAATNYQFCAGLKDREPPSLPSPTEKDAVVKFLGASFDYCAAVIRNLTEPQLTQRTILRTGISPGVRFCSRCTFRLLIIVGRPKSICATRASSRRPT